MKNLPELKDLEKCVRCGSCKAYCPTYDEDNTEAMGARGRLALLRGLLLQELKPTPLLNEKFSAASSARHVPASVRTELI